MVINLKTKIIKWGGIMPNQRNKHRFILILPTGITLLAIAMVPLIYIGYRSFFQYNLAMPVGTHFIGIENYLRAFGSSSFWNSVKITIKYLVLALPIQLLIGFGIALLLNKRFWGNNLAKVLLATPLVLSPAVMAIIWRLMFNPQTSLINHWISAFGLSAPNWLGAKSVALWSVIIIDSWQWLPFIWLILLAGLGEIPSPLYDAAQVDGASSYHIFRYITLPLLSSKILLILLFRGLLILKDFDKIFVLTGGGPAETTETLSLHTYFNAFWWFDIGYASALSVLYLLMVIAITTIIFRRVKL